MSETPIQVDESDRDDRRRRLWRRRNILILLSTPAALLIIYLTYLTVSSPSVKYLRDQNPDATSLMHQRFMEARAEGKEPKRIQEWISIDDVSARILQAVIMGEDASFYTHNGFDFHEIKETLRTSFERGRIARGASTITQQTAKNLFLSTEKSLSRKLKEAILAVRLERALSKRRILEVYLNVIEWGPDIYGVEAAARVYFGKHARSLDAAESAALVAMIPNPRRLQPATNLKSLKVRQERVLGWMKMAGHLTEEEYQQAVNQPLRFK